MRIPVSIRWAVYAAALTTLLAICMAGAATARAQGAAGAGGSSSALPAQPSPSHTSSANSNSLPEAASASARSSEDSYEPITGEGRLLWLAQSTLYPKSLLAGVFSAAIGTGLDHPREYGPHWDGFGDRYGMRLTGIATSDVMEAGLGALWGEDPRYKREPEKSFGGRLGSVIEQGFMTRRRDGHFAPAYARFLAVSGSNFLSNTWRADSEADNSHAGYRIGLGFAGQIGSNAWDEFWPSISSHIFHHGN